MKCWGRFLVAISCWLLAACATGAQVEGLRQNQIYADMKPTLDACIKAIDGDPSYAVLRTKLIIDEGIPTLEMLSDRTKPTKQDVEALYKLHNAFQGCRKIILDAAAQAHPMRVVAYAEMYTAVDRVWADLVSGKSTWGEFNQAREAAKVTGREKLAQVEAQIRSGLQHDHDTEMRQRQQAAQAMQEWSAQQQAIAAANRPRTTDCNFMGNTASCTSY
jgi:hypothetical protein